MSPSPVLLDGNSGLPIPRDDDIQDLVGDEDVGRDYCRDFRQVSRAEEMTAEHLVTSLFRAGPIWSVDNNCHAR